METSSPSPNRNVELKVRMENEEEFLETMNLVISFVNWSHGLSLQQTDTFYNTNPTDEVTNGREGGRLKLRNFGDGNADLIFYRRTNKLGAKESQYHITRIQGDREIANLSALLNSLLGINGPVVEKRRILFLYENTHRIHMDIVKDLGHFVEIEVILKPTQTVEDGERILNIIKEKLRLKEENFISGAYHDLLATSTPWWQEKQPSSSSNIVS